MPMKRKGDHGGARPGSGRPVEYKHPRVKLSVMMDAELLKDLDDLRGDATRSSIVGRAVRSWVKARQLFLQKKNS